jgi:hypothetical protein
MRQISVLVSWPRSRSRAMGSRLREVRPAVRRYYRERYFRLRVRHPSFGLACDVRNSIDAARGGRRLSKLNMVWYQSTSENSRVAMSNPRNEYVAGAHSSKLPVPYICFWVLLQRVESSGSSPFLHLYAACSFAQSSNAS